MCLKTLSTYETKYSKVILNNKVVSFHTKEVGDFNFMEKYTALGIIYVDGKILLVKKKNGLYAIPGGGSERPMQNYLMFKEALDNVQCNENIRQNIINLIDDKMSYPPLINCAREVLEEVGVFAARPVYFGHQKTKDWRDEIVFTINSVFSFSQDEVREVIKLEELLNRKYFLPIGKSVCKNEPYAVFDIEKIIQNINNVVFSHQIILAHFLLTLVKTEPSVGLMKDKLEAIIGIV